MVLPTEAKAAAAQHWVQLLEKSVKEWIIQGNSDDAIKEHILKDEKAMRLFKMAGLEPDTVENMIATISQEVKMATQSCPGGVFIKNGALEKLVKIGKGDKVKHQFLDVLVVPLGKESPPVGYTQIIAFQPKEILPSPPLQSKVQA